MIWWDKNFCLFEQREKQQKGNKSKTTNSKQTTSTAIHSQALNQCLQGNFLIWKQGLYVLWYFSTLMLFDEVVWSLFLVFRTYCCTRPTNGEVPHGPSSLMRGHVCGEGYEWYTIIRSSLVMHILFLVNLKSGNDSCMGQTVTLYKNCLFFYLRG